MTTLILYKDLDLNLYPHPVNFDIPPKINQEAVKRSLFNLLRWSKWTIPFEPKSSNYIDQSLFDNIDLLSAINIKDRIHWLISTYEPRCTVISVEVEINVEENGYNIIVEYRIDSLKTIEKMSIFLTAIR